MTRPITDPDENHRTREARTGLLYGFTAYTMWGVFPLYFKTLAHVSPWRIVCHRILWSALFLGIILAIRNEWRRLGPAVRQAHSLRLLAAGGVLIALNWLIFIYAVTTSQVLEASLGYFINPLLSVALGLIFLRERLRRGQWVAVVIAAMAVVNLAWRGEKLPWIALALAGTFGLYGLVRKKVDLPSHHALLVETMVLVPVALVGLAWLPTSEPKGVSPKFTFGLLALTGVITATPLLFFGAAVRRLRLSTIGFLQYIGPTLQFVVAVLAFREPLDHAKLASFGLCWVAIAVYVADSLVKQTPPPVADRPE